MRRGLLSRQSKMQVAPDVVDEQLAHWNGHSRVFACKSCPLVAKHLLKGFSRELYNWRRMALSISSDHLIPLDSCFLAIDEKEQSNYIVMPRLRPLPRKPCRAAAKALCHCIRDMCRLGIYHLDIKPENIMRGAEGQYVLIDYGLMCFSDTDDGFPGTRGYIDSTTTDCESRVVYALGRTLNKLGLCDSVLFDYSQRRGKRSMERLCSLL